MPAVIDVEKSANKTILNMKGEEAAARFLYRRDYEILERDWACNSGAVPIIAKDGNTLVFVDVKTRSETAKGFPSDTISKSRRDRFEKIALTYLETHPEVRDCPVRLDVVALVILGRDRALIRHHINAVSAPSVFDN